MERLIFLYSKNKNKFKILSCFSWKYKWIYCGAKHANHLWTCVYSNRKTFKWLSRSYKFKYRCCEFPSSSFQETVIASLTSLSRRPRNLHGVIFIRLLTLEVVQVHRYPSITTSVSSFFSLNFHNYTNSFPFLESACVQVNVVAQGPCDLPEAPSSKILTLFQNLLPVFSDLPGKVPWKEEWNLNLDFNKCPRWLRKHLFSDSAHHCSHTCHLLPGTVWSSLPARHLPFTYTKKFFSPQKKSSLTDFFLLNSCRN